jgi:hypothetical protein
MRVRLFGTNCWGDAGRPNASGNRWVLWDGSEERKQHSSLELEREFLLPDEETAKDLQVAFPSAASYQRVVIVPLTLAEDVEKWIAARIHLPEK